MMGITMIRDIAYMYEHDGNRLAKDLPNNALRYFSILTVRHQFVGIDGYKSAYTMESFA